MDLPFLVVYLHDNRIKFVVQCHHCTYLHKCNKNKFIFVKLHCLFLGKYLGGALLLTPCI